MSSVPGSADITTSPSSTALYDRGNDRQSLYQLQVCGVGKSFQRQGVTQVVLEDINIALRENEFVCLVGASGCGKSTLLRIAAGLMPPTVGQIRIGNHVAPGPGADRGMVFQNYSLFPWRTVAANVAFGLELQGLSKAQRQEKVDYYLKVVGLSDFRSAYPKQLSGGMKQRVAIARALANQPQVLLMDEPFGALDAQTKSQMQQFMQALWEETQITVLMVTHDVEEAIFLSERIYVMDRHPGRIKAELAIKLGDRQHPELRHSSEFTQYKRQIFALLGE
jgi:NitT/TauT family transport system ATP-binding protein